MPGLLPHVFFNRYYHCLEMGGEHVRLTLFCAEICETSAKFLMCNSDLHKETCRVCATVCADCADDRQRVGDMDECVDACRDCAQSCEKMAAL